MERHGFRILAAWETSTHRRTEFVYLLEWLDTRRWPGGERLRADEEWAEVKRKTAAHGALVGDIDERVLRAVPYLPTGWAELDSALAEQCAVEEPDDAPLVLLAPPRCHPYARRPARSRCPWAAPRRGRRR